MKTNKNKGLNMYAFFFNDTATTEIYTLSLHDALPIWPEGSTPLPVAGLAARLLFEAEVGDGHAFLDRLAHEEKTGGKSDRKSTRLNSSHANISYAVFCLKKKPI